jgi:hypothetical protein
MPQQQLQKNSQQATRRKWKNRYGPKEQGVRSPAQLKGARMVFARIFISEQNPSWKETNSPDSRTALHSTSCYTATTRRAAIGQSPPMPAAPGTGPGCLGSPAQAPSGSLAGVHGAPRRLVTSKSSWVVRTEVVCSPACPARFCSRPQLVEHLTVGGKRRS